MLGIQAVCRRPLVTYPLLPWLTFSTLGCCALASLDNGWNSYSEPAGRIAIAWRNLPVPRLRVPFPWPPSPSSRCERALRTALIGSGAPAPFPTPSIPGSLISTLLNRVIRSLSIPLAIETIPATHRPAKKVSKFLATEEKLLTRRTDIPSRGWNEASLRSLQAAACTHACTHRGESLCIFLYLISF